MAEDGEGGVALTVAEDAPEEVQREVAAAIEPFVPGSIESVERYIEQAAAARSPAERGVKLEVPRLQLSVQGELRSEEHTSELQSLMRISYAVFCLKKKINHQSTH